VRVAPVAPVASPNLRAHLNGGRVPWHHNHRRSPSASTQEWDFLVHRLAIHYCLCQPHMVASPTEHSDLALLPWAGSEVAGGERLAGIGDGVLRLRRKPYGTRYPDYRGRSTITKANGFGRRPVGAGSPRPYFEHLAQGFAPTSVAAGDVGLGVDQAIADLQTRIPNQVSRRNLVWNAQPEIFVNSSAAGGLRMTVHGLTHSMTVRAAREAALGAGAIVKLVTAAA